MVKRPEISSSVGFEECAGQEVPLLTPAPRTPEILMVLLVIVNIQWLMLGQLDIPVQN